VLIFLNGEFVPEERAVISVFDRGFLYGDGLFEGVLVRNGKFFRWRLHLDRLQRGADFLKIKLPFAPEALHAFARDLLTKNDARDAFLRLTLSRGVGPRGYSPKGADRPTLVMSLHPVPGAPASGPALRREGAGPEAGAPMRWKLATSSFRLPADEPLAQFKTCNKLPQVLARGETEAHGANETLLLNTDGFVVEGSSSNLFWITGETVCTTPLASGILPGVTRAVVLEICQALNLPAAQTNIRPKELQTADGVFVSLSSFGVVEAESLDGKVLRKSPVTEKIRLAYEELVRSETADASK
jgi:branched-chain amino acid aminotransferase